MIRSNHRIKRIVLTMTNFDPRQHALRIMLHNAIGRLVELSYRYIEFLTTNLAPILGRVDDANLSKMS